MRRICKIALWGLGLLLLPTLAEAQEMLTVPAELVAYSDTIVYNGKIVTVDDPSVGLNTPMGTIGEAMAIRQGKIQAVGTNKRILGLAGPKTDKIDLKGRMVMPGIVDTHTHIHNNELGYWQQQNLAAVAEFAADYSVPGKTDAELERGIRVVIQEHVAKPAGERWAYIAVGAKSGSGTSPGVSYLRRKNFTMAMLDRLMPDHPAILYSHPSYVINSAGIRAIEKLYGAKMSMHAAGIDEWGRSSSWVRNISGDFSLTSILIGESRNWPISFKGAWRKTRPLGITTYISHIQGQRFLDAFNILSRQERMPIRFAWLHGFGTAFGYPDAPNFYRRMGDLAGMGTDYFWLTATRPGGSDDGPPNICSTMEAPQAMKEMEACHNDPDSNIFETTRVAIANYHRVVTAHAYGDKGVDYYMDAVEAAMRDNPAITLEHIRSLRLAMDHCGFYPRKDQIPRMAKLGIMISCGGNTLSRSYPWIGPGKYAPQYINRILIEGIRKKIDFSVSLEEIPTVDPLMTVEFSERVECPTRRDTDQPPVQGYL